MTFVEPSPTPARPRWRLLLDAGSLKVGGTWLHECRKPDCDRAVPVSMLFCCPACSTADAGRFAIDKHSDGCDETWAKRRRQIRLLGLDA
ncbi:hypothetical protein [Nonomuraea soli]|uniref:Uncharacterized protein n=1 Tax=Nonomuraea soli TaxID=1032476 RepID=A0A7W0HUQ4_9ACTN|nr:hypothetical protein [Nonomuraea soli]MBA2896424.1 hypothetical protein [Nonomuraea soli]